jgi:1-deoxyxylulose-5-phosphate synthase
VVTLEAPYTPHYDFQGVSDDAALARISAQLGIKPARA